MQVKMPKAYKILPEPAVFQWGDETTNIAVVQSNAEGQNQFDGLVWAGIGINVWDETCGLASASLSKLLAA